MILICGLLLLVILTSDYIQRLKSLKTSWSTLDYESTHDEVIAFQIIHERLLGLSYLGLVAFWLLFALTC